LIKLLAARGYKVVPEAARSVIDEEEAKGSNALPWLNLEQFQARVAQKQLELEAELESEITIHDRGLVDGHAYAVLGRVKPPAIIEKVARGRYEKVFILEPLPSYVNDRSRRESQEEALRIHAAIVQAYDYFGYKPVLVPVLAPPERMEFIVRLL